MAPGSDALGYHQYEVLRPVLVEAGEALPVSEFGAKGGAMQYFFDMPIAELIEQGILRELP